MEIPAWFGLTEYYALIATVWFGIATYLLIALVTAKREVKIKENIVKLRSWWNERKKKKEEEPYG